jgi:VWFA-related protein
VGPRDVSWLVPVAALWAAQQPPAPPQFPASVEQVVVDAVVLDGNGAPVSGLSRDDFLVAEDGKPQAVASFEAVEVRAEPGERQPGAASRVGVATNAVLDSPAPRRTIVIVFDDLGLGPPQGERARAAVGAFVRAEVVGGDQLSLVSTSGHDRWVASTREEIEDLLDVLARLKGRAVSDPSADLMTDAEACLIHVRRDARTVALVAERYQAAGVPLAGQAAEQLVSADAASTCQRATTRARRVLETLASSARSLQGVRGRKAVVIVSAGVLFDAGMPEYRQLLEACREANVAVYFLDATGLEAPPTNLAVSPVSPFRALSGQRPPAEGGADQEILAGAFATPGRDAAAVTAGLADETGGFTVRDTNDLAGGLGRIARDVRAYYLLGYVSTNPARDGRYRRITVRLSERGGPSRKGWRVRARRGYDAPNDADAALAPARPEQELRRILDSPVARSDVPLRLAAYALEDSSKAPGTIRCVVVTEVDTRALAPARQGGQPGDAGLDVAYETLPRDGGPGERVVKRVKPRAGKAPGWLTVAQEMALPPGVHRVTVAARDVASGRSGSVSVRLDVPPTGVLRVSKPVVSALGQAGATDRSHSTLLGPLELTPADSARVAFMVYGARSDPASGEPRLSVSYAVVPAGDEAAAAAARLTRVATDATASQQVVSLGLAGFEPGPYLFVGRVVDEVASRQVTFTEPFTVTPAPETAPAPAARPVADPELATLLELAGRYVVDYERALHDIAAEEDYSQRSPNSEGSGLPDWLRTRADIVFVRLAPPFPWATFRDVYEVNGSPVRDRDGRLERAFRESPDTAVARAEAILTESTRYNIGPERTVNLPTLALLVLHPANQPRFAFERKRRKGTGMEVAFREQARPTIFREFIGSRRQVEPGSVRPTQRGADLPAEGRFRLDPRRGTVLRSEVRFRFPADVTTVLMTRHGGRASDGRATITTTYRAEPALAMWVPVEMKERYEGGSFGLGTDAVARYSHFRKFEVTVEQGGVRVTPP